MSPMEARSGKYDGDGRWIRAAVASSNSSYTWPDGGAGSMGTARPLSSSVYLRCHRSSRAVTTGTLAKLNSGGGEAIDHSSVRASQGSAGAGGVLRARPTLGCEHTNHTGASRAPA